MIKTYTHDEMLALWRLNMMLEPMRSDGVTSHSDGGVCLDEWLSMRIRSWYAGLLRTADVGMLPVTDIAATSTLLRQHDGSGVILLDPSVVRVVEVKLGGWERPAEIITDAADPRALLQQSPFTRGGTVAPVAVVDHNRLRLYSPPAIEAHPAIERLKVVIEPIDDTYVLDTAALALIPGE